MLCLDWYLVVQRGLRAHLGELGMLKGQVVSFFEVDELIATTIPRLPVCPSRISRHHPLLHWHSLFNHFQYYLNFGFSD